jgi:cell division protein FtsL
MTHVETARINELVGLQIGAVQEEAQLLDVNSDLQELEAGISALEKRIAELKATLEAIPHDHP